MIDKLVGSVVDPLAQRWVMRAVGGAVVFWAVGALLYLWSHPDAATCVAGSGALWCRLEPAGTAGGVVAALLGAAVVVGSAQLVAALAGPATHTLAGIGWPLSGPAARFTAWRVRRHHRRRQRLARVSSSDRQLSEGRIVAALRRFPGGPVRLAPTRLGNVFAAMVQRVADRHGLRLPACWEAFMCVLPERDRQRIAERSGTVLARAQSLLWAVATAGWAVLLPSPMWWVAWWTGVGVAAAAFYVGLCHAVEAYCEHLEGQLAVHRAALYRAVGFPLPATTAEEAKAGAELSDYLDDAAWRAVPLDCAGGERS